MCQHSFFDKPSYQLLCLFQCGGWRSFIVGQPGYPTRQVAYETGYYSTVFQPRDGGTSVESVGDFPTCWVDIPPLSQEEVSSKIIFFVWGRTIFIYVYVYIYMYETRRFWNLDDLSSCEQVSSCFKYVFLLEKTCE